VRVPTSDICERGRRNAPLRLAIFTSHPIQYQAPWFRALAQVPDLELKVFFSYIPDAKQQGDGFGKAFEWDVPLLEGYCWESLQGFQPPAWGPDVLKNSVRGLGKAIRTYRPEVALILGWHHMSLIQAVVACRLMHVSIVLRGESNSLRRRPIYKRAMHRLLFAQCAAFLAIGSKNADFYKASGVAAQKISTAPYFVDNDWFLQQDKAYRPARNVLRETFGIAPESICFCFVGKLEPKKRILDFISAFRLAYAKRSDLSALIVGTGLLENVAKAEVERANIPVAFAGFLNQSEISKAYVAADVIVLPSDYGETWGLVVNEAMVSGLPALVSDRVGCAHDLVVDGKTGFVFSFDDVGAFAGRMLDLAENRDNLRSMGRRAQEHVLTRFSMTEAVEKTLKAAGACRVATYPADAA
jgi:glycosyltransferase involved in cell wall biosynthesis